MFAVLLYDIFGTVNAFDDIWRKEFYYSIASVKAQSMFQGHGSTERFLCDPGGMLL